jgi:hypothetical protein
MIPISKRKPSDPGSGGLFYLAPGIPWVRPPSRKQKAERVTARVTLGRAASGNRRPLLIDAETRE